MIADIETRPAIARRMQPALGTYVEAAATTTRPGQAEAAIDAALGAIHHAQRLWSFQDTDSELSRLNRQPGQRMPLSPLSCRLLRLARATMQASAGLFDITLGGLLVADGLLPDHGGPAPLPRGSASDLAIGRDWACLRRPLRLTLDGIAKGFAVDLAIDAMRAAGADAGWVNAGGDLRAFGDITVPVTLRQADGRLATLGGLRDMALATSTVPEHPSRAEPSFPGRILAPGAVAPAPGSWTVAARRCWRADALTKVAACLPAGQRRAVLLRLGGRLVEGPAR